MAGSKATARHRPNSMRCFRRWPRCRSASPSRSRARSISMGEVQAIGGVNEKIEGFFDLCSAGPDGRHGVLIPQLERAVHLMLRPDIVAAAEAGHFPFMRWHRSMRG